MSGPPQWGRPVIGAAIGVAAPSTVEGLVFAASATLPGAIYPWPAPWLSLVAVALLAHLLLCLPVTLIGLVMLGFGQRRAALLEAESE